MSLCGIAWLHSDQGGHLEAQTEPVMSLSALSGCRMIYYSHEAAELVSASFFPPMRSKEIKKKKKSKPKPGVSLPGFFHFDRVCLGRFMVAQALITKS